LFKTSITPGTAKYYIQNYKIFEPDYKEIKDKVNNQSKYTRSDETRYSFNLLDNIITSIYLMGLNRRKINFGVVR